MASVYTDCFNFAFLLLFILFSFSVIHWSGHASCSLEYIWHINPRIIAGGDYYFFRLKKGRLFEGRRLFEGGDYFKKLLAGSHVLKILINAVFKIFYLIIKH